MSKWLLLLAILALSGCTDDPRKDWKTKRYQMECTDPVASPNNNIRRCENQETICYVYGGEGIWCDIGGRKR